MAYGTGISDATRWVLEITASNSSQLKEDKRMDYSKKHEISVYLTEEQLNQRIAEIGAQITERFRGESVYLVCILKGSIFFTTELAKRLRCQ